jgi:hypothetical protein
MPVFTRRNADPDPPTIVLQHLNALILNGDNKGIQILG